MAIIQKQIISPRQAPQEKDAWDKILMGLQIANGLTGTVANLQTLFSTNPALAEKVKSETALQTQQAEYYKLKPGIELKEVEAKKTTEQFSNANKIRDEISKRATRTREVEISATKVIEAAKLGTGAGDVALINGYVRTVDPGASVKEGEFAMVEKTKALTDETKMLFKRILSGERLTDTQRKEFASSALQQFNIEKNNFNNEIKRYDPILKNFNIRVEDVLVYQPSDLDKLLNTTIYQINNRNRSNGSDYSAITKPTGNINVKSPQKKNLNQFLNRGQ